MNYTSFVIFLSLSLEEEEAKSSTCFFFFFGKQVFYLLLPCICQPKLQLSIDFDHLVSKWVNSLILRNNGDLARHQLPLISSAIICMQDFRHGPWASKCKALTERWGRFSTYLSAITAFAAQESLLSCHGSVKRNLNQEQKLCLVFFFFLYGIYIFSAGEELDQYI